MDEQLATHEPAEETAPPSRWEDYIDIFISPVELYRRRAHDRLAPPLVTLLLLSLAFYLVLLPAQGMIMRTSLAQNPDAAAAMERFTTAFLLVGSIAVPITYLVIVGFAAFMLWLVGRFAEIRTEFSRTMLIATYAGFVFLLAQIAGSVALLLHGEAGLDVVRHMSFGPLRFLGDADMNPVTMALLRRFEIFTIWQVVLWGIGIAVVYGTSRARAAITAFMTWLLLAVPSVIMAMLGIGQAARGG
jgi:hypothetical protein